MRFELPEDGGAALMPALEGARATGAAGCPIGPGATTGVELVEGARAIPDCDPAGGGVEVTGTPKAWVGPEAKGALPATGC
jgi:hypothetical protein